MNVAGQLDIRGSAEQTLAMLRADLLAIAVGRRRRVVSIGLIATSLTIISLQGCSTATRHQQHPVTARLRPCPASPNCVSSDANDDLHRIAPFRANDAQSTWQALRMIVANLPRTKVVRESNTYLHAECRSATFGFVDDLELQLRPSSQTIAVRSSSRTGYRDFGVNRERIERIRAELLDHVLRPAE